MAKEPELNVTEALLGRAYAQLFLANQQNADLRDQLQSQSVEIATLTAAVAELQADATSGPTTRAEDSED